MNGTDRLEAIVQNGSLVRNVAFIHIPKAGGSSVRGALRHMVPESCVFPELQLHHGPEYESLRTDGYYLFMSHLGHHFAEAAEAATLTILRHPIERLLSLYSYYNNPGRGMPILDKSRFGNMSLSQFLTCEIPQVRMNIENQQVWQVGYGYFVAEREAFYKSSTKHISVAALENLDRMTIVGTTDDIEGFLERASRLLGARPERQASRSNESSERIRWSDLSADERRLVESKVELEWVLYDRARKRA